MRRMFLVASCLLPLFSLGAAEPATPRTPNILLIVADDLGWSDVGWHGGFAKTPVMDGLVKTGVELDRHYVQPVCTPTRTALMSGRYPVRFGPQALAPSNLRAMDTDTVTLAAALRSKGYRTHQTGKWHLGAKPAWGPNAFGFDTSYGTLTGAADPWTHKYRKGPYEDTWHRDGTFFHEDGNATELISAEAVRRIKEQRSPWFLYVPFHAVHTPVDAPSEYLALYDGVTFHVDPAKQNSRLRLAAMISQMDAAIGRFVAALDETDQRDNTLIVFTSDNGGIESLKNAYVSTVPDSPLNSENDPLRGQKGTLYEGGTRVCAFANWAGVLKPGKYATPMHAVDWFPTLAAAVGYRPAADLQWDGIDHWEHLHHLERTPGASDPATTRSIYIAKRDECSILCGVWKLIAGGHGKTQLFHLERDPFEKDDLVDKEPGQVAKLRKLLDEHRQRDRMAMPEDLRDAPG